MEIRGMAKKATKRAPKKTSKTGSNRVNWRKIMRWIGIVVMACFIAVFVVFALSPFK
jgi:magnesium-transporting ATPase (P-type)